MNVIIKYLLFLLLLQLHVLVLAQVDVFESDSIPNQIHENLDIYLVIGQSNMAGRAAVREEDMGFMEHVYLFTGNSMTPWVLASNPLNRYSTIRKEMEMQKLSPAYAFAKSMAAELSDREIGVVMNARGGTKIVQWLPGTRYYQEAIRQTHQALKYGTLKGIIWHQGEGDWHPVRVDLYLGRLEILINAVREEFDDPTIPFVAGQVFENENRHGFNEMILQLPDFIEYTGVLVSEGTNTMEGTHFDSESAILLEERYASEMKRIQFEFNKKR